MPLFFFEVADLEPRLDPETAELPDVHGACHEALKRLARNLEASAAEILRAEQFSLTLRDAEGLHILRLDLTATVAPIARTQLQAKLGRGSRDRR